MSERSTINARARGSEVSAAGAPAAVAVSAITSGTSFSLRVAPQIAETVRGAAGFDLTGRINTATAAGDQIAARLGPDEWLLMAPDGQGEALGEAISKSLAGSFHSLVDVSHRNVSMTVSGSKAAIVLNAGVAIDLDDRVFPAGSATRTVLGKAEIVLVRPGADSLYRVQCWRTFAPYVHNFLEDAAREFNGR